MKRLLVSTRKGLVIYKMAQKGWQYESLHFEGIPVSLSYFDENKNCLWAFQDHGHWGVKMQRSFDFGNIWEEVASPVYPDGEEVKDGVPASLKYVWAVQHISQPSHKLLIGTDPGGLFISEDNGENWILNRGLWDREERKTSWFGGGRDNPGIHSLVVDPRNNNHIYIGISCGGVYETFDGGISWHGKNKGLVADFLPDPHSEYGHDPHMLLASACNPDVLWQQNHCGIFRTSDGGNNWNNVGQEGGPAHFGFALTLDDRSDQRAWVAPAVSDGIRVAINQKLIICRTENAGKSWQVLDKGLPVDISFDIVYRHSLISNDDEIAFGTTTGNLFYSSDGGDHWQVVSNYLPMIYALSLVEF